MWVLGMVYTASTFLAPGSCLLLPSVPRYKTLGGHSHVVIKTESKRQVTSLAQLLLTAPACGEKRHTQLSHVNSHFSYFHSPHSSILPSLMASSRRTLVRRNPEMSSVPARTRERRKEGRHCGVSCFCKGSVSSIHPRIPHRSSASPGIPRARVLHQRGQGSYPSISTFQLWHL